MATIVRIDAYSIEVDGIRVRATPEQEEAIQDMSEAELARFMTIMTGGKS